MKTNLKNYTHTHTHTHTHTDIMWASQMVLVVKNTSVNAGDKRDADSISGLGRSSGGGHSN